MSRWFSCDLSERQRKIVQKLQDFAERRGRRPYQNELGRVTKTPTLAEILKDFPSYKDALRAAHLPVLLPTKDDLVDAVLVFCERNEGQVPSREDALAGRMLYGALAFDKQYPNWDQLITDAQPEIDKIWGQQA